MAENNPQGQDDAGAVQKNTGGNNKLMPLILIVNTVLMGAVLAIVLLRKPPAPAGAASADLHGEAEKGKSEDGEKGKEGEKGHEGAKEGKVEGPGAPGPILKLENFIIQLRGSDSDRYVRVAFDLELGSEGDRVLVQARMSQIRDSIISYFSDRSLDELRGSEGIDRIKSAVSKRLDEILVTKPVRAVFVTELVIQ